MYKTNHWILNCFGFCQKHKKKVDGIASMKIASCFVYSVFTNILNLRAELMNNVETDFISLHSVICDKKNQNLCNCNTYERKCSYTIVSIAFKDSSITLVVIKLKIIVKQIFHRYWDYLSYYCFRLELISTCHGINAIIKILYSFLISLLIL